MKAQLSKVIIPQDTMSIRIFIPFTIIFLLISCIRSTRLAKPGPTLTLFCLSPRLHQVCQLTSYCTLSIALLLSPINRCNAVYNNEVAKYPASVEFTTKGKEKREQQNWRELLLGLSGGATSRISKELLLHPIDTVKSRIQGRSFVDYPENSTNLSLFANLYDGIVPSLVGGVPAGAVFFGVKDFSKSFLRATFPALSKEEVTILSVAAANIPYWIVRTPSEVIKTRDQLNVARAGRASLQELVGMYSNFAPNILYALPADILKFVVYEHIVTMYLGSTGKVEGAQAAVAGSIASAIAQLLTTPLDVVRVRLMASDKNRPDSIVKTSRDIWQKDGLAGFFLGSTPRLARALVSGAIQFATYELTRNFLG